MARYKYLILVLIFGSILRLIYLGSFNPGFFRDEAAIAYNAYSIWQTGKDEFGMSYPIVFRSFEVFFMPLYIYLLSPIVGIFGLNEFNARVLSAISGIFGILAAYLIAFQIWKNDKIALLSAFLTAISPVSILYSRGTFEGNLALTLFAYGFWALLKFIENNSIKSLTFSALFFTLSMYSYQSERLIVPFLGVVTFVLFYKKIISLKFKLLIPILLTLFLMMPILSLIFEPGSYHRAFGVSVFSRESNVPGWVEGENEGLIVNDSIFLRGRQFAALYLSYFSPRNLFFEGDANLQRGAVNFSAFYGILLPALIIGLFLIFKKNKDLSADKSKEIKLLIAWILLAPLPASLTSDPFHTYRSLLFYFPLTLVTSLGLYNIFLFLRWRILTVGILIILCFNLSQFLYSYFALTPVARAADWDYGYKELIGYLNTQTDYTKIVIDDKKTEGYIHWLFLNKLDPKIYHAEVANLGGVKDYYYSNADKIRPDHIGKVYFRKVNWPSERGDNKTIFVFPAERLFPSEFENDPKIKLLKEIYYPDKTVAFRVLKIDKPADSE